ncbi:hypothetical protein BAOM_3050 [Peribacillus asahii]|uniref:HNH nuclease domain-containing protein n=1 Tax=Peribacillus asahii TaxID=228899 RepID=A0A3T0KT95_9BACI|nr:HNH endonuclease [Peribacillus asahii]AZV43659.1 hypothetical protein BAOM_3050 [Peribacillus asahii]
MVIVCDIKTKKEKKFKFPYENNHKYICGVEHKLCSDCNEWLLMTDEFYYKNSANRVDGYNPYCKECTIRRSATYVRKPENWKRKLELKRMRKNRDKSNEYLRKRKAENEELREYIKEYNKNYRKNNKDKIKIYNNNRMQKNHDITTQEWNSCKSYFNHSCAYCGISEVEAKDLYGQNLHREHVIPEGRNDLKNCVPACRMCNSLKNRIPFNTWYNPNNPIFSEERYLMIYKWLRFDVKKFMKKKKK